MSGLNGVLRGRLGDVPHPLKEGRPALRFSVASHRKGRDNEILTDWWECVWWKPFEDVVARMRKGTRVVLGVAGTTWKGEDGNRRTQYSVQWVETYGGEKEETSDEPRETEEDSSADSPF